MSIFQTSGKVVPSNAKAYGLTLGEPSTQWWSANITAGLNKTWGSWVQLVAATTEDVLLWLVLVIPPVYYGADWGAVAIGTGAASSEVEVLSLPVRNTTGTIDSVYFHLPVPILVPSGTRIAARMAIDANMGFPTGIVALGHIKASVVSSF